jgi:TonB family protein
MLEQLERHETREQLAAPRLEIAPPLPVVENDQRQRRRMVIALVLLLVALGLVLVKDRDFWFSSPEASDSEGVEDSPANSDASAVTPAETPTNAAAIPTTQKKGHVAARTASKNEAPAIPQTPIVTTSRAVLPPLRVEVVAGDRHQLVRPGSPSVRVDLEPSEPADDASGAVSQLANAASQVTNVGDRVQMSADTRQALTRPVRPEYPLLARQMKVQGAVGMIATIGKDGGIQTLKVTSGPAILAGAAREAVKQWRFKPYLQDGQPVETEANITVDFTIRAN